MMEEILKDSSIYQWRMEEGEKARYKKGYRIGIQRMPNPPHHHQICPLPSWAAEKIAAADSPTFNRWLDRILTATSLEDCLIPA